MSGNKVSQQWVITRDDRNYPEVYVELDVNTSQPLTPDAYDLITQATYKLGQLAAHLRHTEPGAAPETIEAGADPRNWSTAEDALADRAATGHAAVRELRDDLRNLVDLAASWAETSDTAGSKGLLAAAQQLTRKYDL